MSQHVTIFEMGPRDGLQNEKHLISTQDKVSLVNQLSDCGFRKIEVTSFVSPKWVPQMADAAEVMAQITRNPEISYAVLTPNQKGLDAALRAGANEVAIFGSASEGFSQANINCSIQESLARFQPVLQSAKAAGLLVRGYVSCVVACPYDGVVSPSAVADIAEKLFAMGCYEISLGDTIGAGTPETIREMLSAVLDRVPANNIAGHYHDTNGLALVNIGASLDMGLRVFDASVGGLGGCPYAPGAKGNVATEAVVRMLHERGFETGIDLATLGQVATFAKGMRSHDL